jgi:hypothetical protein
MRKLLLLLFISIISLSAQAQFSGAFAPANWTFSSTTINGDGSVITTNAPTSITLRGADTGTGSTTLSPYEDYAITIPSTGEISFSYNHVNNDIDDAYYTVNGVEYFITYSGIGTISNIIIPVGSTFSFRVKNYDFCCGRGELTITNFVFTPYPACTGTPIVGTATTNLTAVCPSQNFTLTIPSYQNTGIVFQWQSALSATGPWTNIAGATLPSASVSQTINTWYRCQVTCTNSSMSAFSNVLAISTLSNHPAGTFTIGAGGTYPNFTSAVAAISCGVAGPVTFNVIPNSGPYNEQISIPVIFNTSSINQVIFNGNGNTITSATTSADRYIIRLDGSDYITFNDLNIVSQSALNVFGVHLQNDANFNKFNNCFIDLTSTLSNTGSTSAGIAISGSTTSAITAGLNGANNSITNCRIKGGYYGITINGASATNNSMNNTITNNSIEDFYYYGIYARSISNSNVSSNEFHRPTRVTVSLYVGYYQITSGSNNLLEKNRFFASFGGALSTSTSASYAIYHSGVTASVGNENKVYNNIIDLKGNNGTIYAIYNIGSGHIQYLHNTISMDDPVSTAGVTRGFFQTTAAQGIVFRNNIMSITRGGTGIKYMLYFATTTSGISSNNNILHLNAPAGTNYFGYYATNFITFANWQSANGSAYDQNSFAGNPQYQNAFTGNFTPTNFTLDNVGAPLGVLNDFLGTPRSLVTPDAGAYEFQNAVNDVEISAVSTTLEPCFAANDTIKVNIKNTLGNVLNFATLNLNISWSISGPVNVSGTRLIDTGTLSGGSTINVPIATGINLSALGTYTITATVTSAWDDIATNNNVSRTITVNSVDAVASVNLGCLGSPVTLSLSGYSGSQIQWQIDSGSGFNNINGANTNSFIAPISGTSVFRAIYCSNNLTSAPVTVNAIFVDPPIVIGDSVCFDQNAVATAVSNLSVSWYDAPIGGNLLGLGSSLQVNNLQMNALVYAQTEDGSALNCPSARVPVDLIVGANPVIIPLPADTAFCAQHIMTLDPGPGASTYLWSSGETTQTIQPNATGTYVVTAFSSLGCTSSDSINIIVHPLPVVIANASATTICFGEQVVLTGTGADFYTWDNNVSNGNAFNPTATMSYTVTGLDQNFCTNTDVIIVVVNPLPLVTLGNFPQTCVDYLPFLLTGGSPIGGNYVSSGNSVTANYFDPKAAGLGFHSITYTYTDANGCKASAISGIEVGACTSIESQTLAGAAIKMYPNPTSAEFIVEINSLIKEGAEIMIFNSNGKLVKSEKINLNQGLNQVSYNLQNLARGIYLINIVGNGHQSKHRLVLN